MGKDNHQEHFRTVGINRAREGLLPEEMAFNENPALAKRQGADTALIKMGLHTPSGLQGEAKGIDGFYQMFSIAVSPEAAEEPKGEAAYTFASGGSKGVVVSYGGPILEDTDGLKVETPSYFISTSNYRVTHGSDDAVVSSQPVRSYQQPASEDPETLEGAPEIPTFWTELGM